MKERDAALLGQSEVETHPLFTGLSLRCIGRVMGINRFVPGICPGFFIALVLAHWFWPTLKECRQKKPGSGPGIQQAEIFECRFSFNRDDHRPAVRSQDEE